MKKILQSILDNLADGVVVADRSGKFVYFNPAAERILGIGKTGAAPEAWQEVYGTFRPDMVTPMGRDEMPLFQALSGIESNDVEIFIRNPRIPAGLFISVAGTPLLEEDGKIVGGVVVFRDISDRKAHEEELHRINEFLDSIVENIPDMVFLKDARELRFVRFNRAGEELLGYSREELIGKNDFDLFPEEQARFFTAKDRQVLEERKLVDIPEEPIQTRYRGERILHTKKIPLLDRAGMPRFLLGISADITESKRLEEAERLRDLARHLQRAREEERHRIAREIHDELGQALTGLKYEVSWLSRQTAGDGFAEKLAALERTIEETIRSVRRIVSELRPHVLDHLGLLEAIEWEGRQFEERTGIRCEVHLPEGPLTLDDDRSTSMFRILQETLTNVARHAVASRVEVDVAVGERYVQLVVRDNGRGITPEQIASPRSFGILGMEERVRIFGGSVLVKGGEKGGTTVAVRIPH
jgi:PAS domain S-box-containing protein